MRPFNYYYQPGKMLVFASEPKAILAVSGVPRKINEGRIADFLVDELESIDNTSTFFSGIFRLPPAHAILFQDGQIRVSRYWNLTPGSPLTFTSNEEYAEAFLEQFTKAIDVRLRSAGNLGSMLSGGVDSGSVVAVASRLMQERQEGPLRTFSAVGPDPQKCKETRAIASSASMSGLRPFFVSYANLSDVMPDLLDQSWQLDEPFDNHMALVRAVYLVARNSGVNIMLDGVAGDVVLSEGSFIRRLVKSGQFVRAWNEAKRQNDFWLGGYPPAQELLRAIVSISLPYPLKRALWPLADRLRSKSRVMEARKKLGIRDTFASNVDLIGRLNQLAGQRSAVPLSLSDERALGILHPNLTVARERYDRVASSLGIEPRDPFLDRRLVEFCVRLPGEQLLADGWPKVILRRAMAGKLPDSVCWRLGKDHLGSDFTTAIHVASADLISGPAARRACAAELRHYIETETIECMFEGDEQHAERDFALQHLVLWLLQNTSAKFGVQT